MRSDRDFFKNLMCALGLGYCNGCYRYLPEDLEVDHIIPRVKRGPDNIENWQLLCRSCNATKGKHSPEYLYLSLVYKMAGENLRMVVETLGLNKFEPVELAVELAAELAVELAVEELAERALWVEAKKERVLYYLNN